MIERPAGDSTALALQATRRLRDSSAFRGLSATERTRFAGDLDRIENVLRGQRAAGARTGANGGAGRYGDPYALGQATPADLQRDLAGPGSTGVPAGGSAPAPAAPAAPAAPVCKSAFETFRDTGDAISSVNFPGFVASLEIGR